MTYDIVVIQLQVVYGLSIISKLSSYWLLMFLSQGSDIRTHMNPAFYKIFAVQFTVWERGLDMLP